MGGGGLPRGEQRGCAPLSPQPYVQLEPNATPQLRETRAHPGCPVESTRTPGMGRRKPLGWVVGSLGVSKGVPPLTPTYNHKSLALNATPWPNGQILDHPELRINSAHHVL